MMALLLMGMVIATTSCNKEEPEEIIEEEEEEIDNDNSFQLPDSEFEFDTDESYLYTKSFYKNYVDGGVISSGGVINGINYNDKFTTYVNENASGKKNIYSILVRVFSSEEELLKSDFTRGYISFKNKGLIDFKKQSYIVICWIQQITSGLPLVNLPLKVYKKDDKLSFVFFGAEGGPFCAPRADYLVVIVDEPNLKQGYVCARSASLRR